MLETEICGIKLENPLLLAAGVMGSTASSMNWVLDSGAAGVVTKSFSTEPTHGYKNPTTVQVEGGIINAIGLSSPGVSNFKEELKLINRNNRNNGINGINSNNANNRNNGNKGNKIAIASIYGSNPEVFAYLVSQVSEFVDIIELNVSCPHAMGGCGAAIGQDPNLVQEVVKASKKASEEALEEALENASKEVSEEVSNELSRDVSKNSSNPISKTSKTSNTPIIAKLTPNVTDIVEIAISAEKGGADGLTLINSLGPGMKIDIKTGNPILSNKFGGMSGPAIKPIAIRCVFDVFNALNKSKRNNSNKLTKSNKSNKLNKSNKYRSNIPIIGVGGIANYKDVVEFLYAGANAVQIGTSIMYEGVEIFSKIATDLAIFMKNNNFESIDEMVGYSHKD
ncbi:MAG: dihydroorotate dehydrogenase [Methanobrevibacter sp.]|jgi:dihydroorotate dehydrogenase (NAD+) catalytic subunit|nr:dihydroorotate dehydrogenase [Methanobrevibacter sp.]